MRYIATIVAGAGLFLLGGCTSLGLGGGPSADELRSIAEDLRAGATVLASAKIAVAADALDLAADTADAAAESAASGNAGAIVESVVGTVTGLLPPPWNAIAGTMGVLGLGAWGRRRARHASQIVVGIEAAGGLTKEQKVAVGAATSPAAKKFMDKVKGNIGNA